MSKDNPTVGDRIRLTKESAIECDLVGDEYGVVFFVSSNGKLVKFLANKSRKSLWLWLREIEWIEPPLAEPDETIYLYDNVEAF